MDDKELNETEESNDELLDDLNSSDDYIDNSNINSEPSFLSNNQISNKKAARQLVDNKINNYGTEALKKVGVPEPLAKQAIKKNGGTFSPTNMPANKLASNMARNKLASGLSKLGGNKLSNLNKMLRNKRKNNSEMNDSSAGEKNSGLGGLNSKKNEAVKNEMNTGAEASDKAKNVTGAIVNAIPPSLKIKIYIVGIIFAVVALILFVIISYFARNKFSDTAAISSYASTGKASYQGNYYDIKGYLVEAGYCDEDDCESSNAFKYISKVNDLILEYNSVECRNNEYVIDEAVNLIVSTVTYGRDSDEYYGIGMSEEEYSEQLEIYLQEYQSLLESIFNSKDIKLTESTTDESETMTCYTFSPDTYKNYVIIEGGYLDTYRQDLGELTQSEKESIYDVITGDAEEVKTTIEESNESANSSGYDGTSIIISSVCTGVTVTGENAGVYSLDDYVAGVVQNENNWYQGDNIENMKAQAIAARTYVLKKTNNCKKSIENSAKSQTFNSNPSEKAKQAALETSNQVLVDKSGNYLSTEYDAFAVKEVTSDFYILKQAELKIPVDWVSSHISSSNLKYYEEHHHGRGMSQWGSRYLQTIGYTYDQILSTFYEDSTLTTLGNSTTGNIPDSVNDLKGRYYFNFDINIYQGNTLFGQCVWYAKHRAMEILHNSSLDESTKQILIKSIQNTSGNGQDWFKNPSNTYFKKSTDINQPKAGSIVSWTRDQYGHVAIIEKVYTDSSGTVMVTLTDGWRTKNSSGKWDITNDLWSVVNFRKKELTLSELRTFGGTFNGYVYLY